MVNVGRGPIAVLLIINFILNLVGVILTGVAVNKLIDGLSGTDIVKHGNNATIFFIPFALIATNVGIAAMLVGIHHLRIWRDDTFAAAFATQEVASMLSQVAVGLAIKEITIGGNRTTLLKSVELLMFLLVVHNILYLLALRASTWTSRKLPSSTQNIV